jgi:D-threo-aldose 1-dehydrogenase
VASVIPGARSPEELRENLRMLRFEIPRELWAELKTRGLMHADAPAPA